MNRILKRGILNQVFNAGMFGEKLINLWVLIARVNYHCFSDHVLIPRDLHRLLYYIRQERELLLEVGQYVEGFDTATPNFHVGLHIPFQIYLYGSSSVFSTSLYEMVHRILKRHVKNCNHHILDRAFINHINQLQTIRLHLNGSFGSEDPVYQASCALKEEAPGFFSSTMRRLVVTTFDDEEEEGVNEPSEGNNEDSTPAAVYPLHVCYVHANEPVIAKA
jgi:hypothetical protein